MILTFGLALDDPSLPEAPVPNGGRRTLGPQGMLHLLESHLGMGGHPNNNDYLRIEQFRQALRRHLEVAPEAFYRHSFEADQFATAAELLSRRDELLLAGWNFQGESLPHRLLCLAAIEALLEEGRPTSLAPGFADRFMAVERQLQAGRPPIQRIFINEPESLLPAHWQRLFRYLETLGVQLKWRQEEKASDNQGDLAVLQRLIQQRDGNTARHALRGDGSLLLLRGKRETDLAAWLAALLRRNDAFRPACLIPHKNRSLDNALIQEGLPSMGILSASLARPTLQVLKLVTVFLWTPIDPFKVMEFLSLSVKPLHDDLANRIAMQMARTPGLMGEGWQRAINAFWAELEERSRKDPAIDLAAIRRQYSFWFERRRYDISASVPKEEVITVFGYLERWALQAFEESGSKNNSLLVLYDQARRIRELLEALPETQLTHLELERIVRTIYEPAPVQVEKQEKGHLPYVYEPHAFTGPVDNILWWNFVEREPDHFFSRWYQSERQFLNDAGIYLDQPQDENARLIWQRKRPVLLTRKRLILVIPEYIDGSPVLQHPLYGDLEARLEGEETITYDIDTGRGGAIWEACFDLPGNVDIPLRQLGRPAPFLEVNGSRQLDRRDAETFSSLNALFYYPYQWVFRHKLLLRKSSILSIVPDHTLLGNLAHRFFEELLSSEDIHRMDQRAVETWVDRQADRLFHREGAVLLMYGREPERISFTRRIKHAAWSLINLLQTNGWKVRATEQPLEGSFLNIPVNGRADLVLEKGEELAVVDLKWRGSSYRERVIRNEEDLQLILYSKLLTPDQSWAHSAYFVMEKGRMIARNNLAFREIIPVDPDADPLEVNQRILKRMQATFRWRMQQIREGRIEVRCAHTQPVLEEEYGDELMDLLEMKQEDAPWDDYRTLIYLVD